MTIVLIAKEVKLMNETITISALTLELLSAGVVAALVTGVFSLIISIKNNKHLMKLEELKHNYSVEDTKNQQLVKAFNELLQDLPEDKQVGHFVMNIPSRKNYDSNPLSEAYVMAEYSMTTIFANFQKYKYLFSKEDQDKFMKAIEELDEITKEMNPLILLINSQDWDDIDDDTKQDFHAATQNRIIKVTEIEEMYFDLYNDYLSR